MKKTIKIKESDLENIIYQVLKEQSSDRNPLCPVQCKVKVLGKGNVGVDIKMIQSALSRCGFNKENEGGGMNVGCGKDHTKCDGKFNVETENAVREFQKKRGITIDGLVGPKTLRQLTRGPESCLKPFKCDCNKKIVKPGDPNNGLNDKIGDSNNGLNDKIGDSNNGINDSQDVKVSCDKSISCFKKFNKYADRPDICALAKCLGVCLPKGMCLGDKTDKCKGCPKYVWMGMQTAVYDAEKEKLRSRCISNKCSIPTRDSRLMFPGNHI